MSYWLARPGQRNLDHSPMNKLMNQLIEDLWEPRFSAQIQEKPITGFTPKINIKETDQNLMLWAELPGMSENDIEVSVDKAYLTISGEKKQESQKDEKGTHYYECSYGRFIRKIPLPFEVNLEKVDAQFSKGILNVNLEKADAARIQSRKIQIQTRS